MLLAKLIKKRSWVTLKATVVQRNIAIESNDGAESFPRSERPSR